MHEVVFTNHGYKSSSDRFPMLDASILDKIQSINLIFLLVSISSSLKKLRFFLDGQLSSRVKFSRQRHTDKACHVKNSSSYYFFTCLDCRKVM